jgi:hypothetical protein
VIPATTVSIDRTRTWIRSKSRRKASETSKDFIVVTFFTGELCKEIGQYSLLFNFFCINISFDLLNFPNNSIRLLNPRKV